MPIDPSAVGQSGGPVTTRWNSKDALLYAVGVGAGTDELAFTTENTRDTPQRVLPTFAVIIGGGGAPFDKIGQFNPAMLVHGEEGIELLGEIPVEGEIESVGKVSAIWDKGKGAVVEMTSESTLVATGEPLLRTRMSAFIRGEGDFGGERGPGGWGGAEPPRVGESQGRAGQGTFQRRKKEKKKEPGPPAIPPETPVRSGMKYSVRIPSL